MEDKEYRNLSQETANYDNMEDKELNLIKILEGHDDELFYSPVWGDTYIAQLRESSIHIIPRDEEHEGEFYFVDSCGRVSKGCFCILYPSREAYLKYPLDAKKAWQEWQEGQKTKQNWWRAGYEGQYWFIGENYTICSERDYKWDDANMRYNMGNYFRTEELAQQAAETVKRTLEQFHKDNQQ